MSQLCAGLDVFQLFEVRDSEFDRVYTSIAGQVFQGGELAFTVRKTPA